ncbi:hypothetical protein [Arthrobacter sp. 35W]|uniref:hypothetical protein n=1 Tax=Arthrobacter sp. 35W TaxID=1132441 RepID=UPI0004098EC2|nr:hypothetical protein [Arthrobacter sp. 35W]
MGPNSSRPRTDLPYLRRRIKPGAAAAAPVVAAPAAAPVSAPASASLSLGRTATAAAPSGGGLSLSRPPSAPAASSAPSGSAGLSLSRPAPTATAQSSGSGSSSLVLGGRGGSQAAPAPSSHQATRTAPPSHAKPSPTRLLFAAPGIDDVRQLDEHTPMVRLNARQSAIGTLLVTGAGAIAWETMDKTTGGATVRGDAAGTPSRTAGNRPLVGFQEQDALVSLRHVRTLRRALFMGRGPAPLGVRIFDGATLTVPAPSNGQMFVLSLLQIGGLLELRAEPLPERMTDQEIWAEFGFTMTHHVAAQRERG